MNYKAEEFNPPNPWIIVDGMEIELLTFNLGLQIKMQKRFGDLNDLYNLLQKEVDTVIEFCWHLVKDKSFFENRIANFKKKLTLEALKNNKIGNELRIAVEDAILNSTPIIINKKRKEDIQKVKSAGKPAKICYANYYDRIASRYSTTLQEFYSLTLRQIVAMLESINDGKQIEFQQQANLAGKKLKPVIEYNEVTEEEEKENDLQAEEAHAELMRKYNESKNNKEV